MPLPASAPSHDVALQATRNWVERAIIGLGLCPFAAPANLAGRLRIVVSPDSAPQAWLEFVAIQAQELAVADPAALETVLAVLPDPAMAFEEFNDLLDPVEDLFDTMGLSDRLQTALFHPRFRFAGTDEHDVQNNVHRSPLPTLHLLRRESLDSVAPERVAEIIERNERRLGALGDAGWRALLDRGD
ncbi:MAG: DUF1415 domain-containing protein [Burkholderiaceae bacterium]